MDRDILIDELLENADLAQRARFKLDDINKDITIDNTEFAQMHIANAEESLRLLQKFYEKEIEKLGGNVV